MNELDIDIRERMELYTNEEMVMISNKCIEKHYEHGLGIVMLEDIHTNFHSIYGKSNNTMEQVLEFKKDYEDGKYPELLYLISK